MPNATADIASGKWRIAQFLEIRWWRGYLKNKDTAQYLAWKRAYWQQFLRDSNIVVPADARVLDAGCGPAGIFICCPTQTVTALDPLLEQYEALPHFRRTDYPNVQFVAAALEDYETSDRYDLVFCLNAINHVRDVALCLDRLRACTRNGGCLVLSVDAHRRPWLKRVFQWLPGDALHPQQYTLADYMAMLEQRGWAVHVPRLLKRGIIFDYCVLVAEKVM